MGQKPLTGQNGQYASAAFDKNSNEIILKLVNSTDKPYAANIILEGSKKTDPKARLITLKSDNVGNVNSLEQPVLISPVEKEIIIKGKSVNQVLEPNSFSVVRIKLLK
jgi:alpha-L-arabinofuranosidase